MASNLRDIIMRTHLLRTYSGDIHPDNGGLPSDAQLKVEEEVCWQMRLRARSIADVLALVPQLRFARLTMHISPVPPTLKTE
ncbi:hypothetical protein ACFIOY_22095 [Bradyrhizobium sp. TZ2]